MNIYEIIGLVVFGGGLIISVIGILIGKKRTGKRWIGQGFGEKWIGGEFMKKNNNNGYISVGIVLIVLQFISYKGVATNNSTLLEITALDHLKEPYGIFYTLGANLFIIPGIILLIIGIKKANKKEDSQTTKSNREIKRTYIPKENTKQSSNNHDDCNNESESDIMKLLNSDRKNK